MNSTNSIKAAMKSFPIGQRRWTVALGLLLSVFALTASAQEVDIDAPTDGATLTVNQPISLSAYADGGEMTISKVLFKENGIAIGTGDTSYPYTATFTPTANGTYVFTAELIHMGNTLATSAPVTVTVTTGGGGGSSNVAPTVSMSSNPTTAAAPATFNLSATAADSDGTVANVKFYADGALLGVDSSSPYTGTYTTSVSGAHTLTAVATDNSGASTTSVAVTVNVTGGSGGGGGGSGPTSVTRTYVYDTNERLCKVIDPEAGATVMDYDAAGNIAWIATGTTLTTNVCNRGMVSAAQKSTRSYDALNRLTGVATPGGAADVTTKYTPDGLVSNLVAANGAAGANPVTTTYSYNKRRLLVSEGSSQPTYAYNLAYGYDANGHLSSLQYPDLQTVTYSPDGLGRVTAVQAGGQNYATAVHYFANGAISDFSYGNGVVHTMTQNARLLPTRSVDKKGASPAVIDDTYAFDKNGNVTDITDAAQAGLTTRGMGYDALDRLTAAISPQQWGNATYTYDAIDNIRTATQGARSFSYNYDLVSNRLTSISGTSSYAFGYDVRGNVTSKGSQDFTFDPSNRMTTAELLSSASVQTYRYDGTGRRVQTTDPGSQSNLWVYSQSGQVVYNHDERRGQDLAYIYLGNTQVATRTYDYLHGGTVSIRYQHTDALGSPVAETDATGVVLKRNSYAPYGEAYGATSIDGTGYTGHVMDRDTGLTYMQQRYYDPQVARFYSNDPIDVDSSGGNFNRSWYANNNPYVFTDMDGRWPTKGHESIIDEAFPGLTDAQRQALKDASRKMDSVTHGGQSTENSYQHGMRSPTQTPADAKKAASDFISGQEGKAKSAQGELPSSLDGIKTESLTATGNAIHTATDRTSPAHTDASGTPQKWSGMRSIPALLEAKRHVAQEKSMTPGQRANAVSAARSVFGSVYGAALLQQATKDPSK